MLIFIKRKEMTKHVKKVEPNNKVNKLVKTIDFPLMFNWPINRDIILDEIGPDQRASNVLYRVFKHKILVITEKPKPIPLLPKLSSDKYCREALSHLIVSKKRIKYTAHSCFKCDRCQQYF